MVDASITLAWCFEDQATSLSEAALQRLAEDGALVPELWPFEIANVMAVAERRGRISQAHSRRFLQLLDQLPITVQELGRTSILTTVLSLAEATGLSGYDASYLTLAATGGLALATSDELLQRAAEQAGIDLIRAE